MGWRALVLLIILVGAAIAMAAWVLSSEERTQRLAVLLGRGRDQDGPPTA
jgi:hypothetical protein